MRILAAALALALAAGPAVAATCTPTAAAMDRLLARYGEAPVARGLSSRCALIVIYAEPDGAWTITMTATDGTSCIRAYGTDMDAVLPPPPPEPQGDPT